VLLERGPARLADALQFACGDGVLDGEVRALVQVFYYAAVGEGLQLDLDGAEGEPGFLEVFWALELGDWAPEVGFGVERSERGSLLVFWFAVGWWVG
jgi:hypothetical protein